MWSSKLGMPGIPAEAEELMVMRDIALTRLTGAPIHFLHLSTAGSIAMVRAAKAQGLPVTAEAAPHHFTLTHAAAQSFDPVFKVNPPLRTDEDVAAVRGGLADGAIDAIATDHAPHPGDEKMQEFEKCPFGIIGLETALGVSLECLQIPLPRLVQLFTAGPARILGIPRGTLAPGAAADVTVFSLDREWTYDVNKSFSKSRNSPFDGRTFKGGPVATIVNAQIVWRA
jgi:dihydroorotase